MFPAYLDGASVIMYAKIEEYGVVEYVTGEPYDTLCYYAIAKYEADDSYYLFGCNSNFAVISDYVCDSIDDCKIIVASHEYNVQWLKL